MKILLTSLIVDDPIKAHKFFTEILGFSSRQYVPEALLAVVVSPEEPDGTALLLEPNDNPIVRTFQEAVYQLGMPVIILGTKDIQADYKRLINLGVVFRREPTKTEYGTETVFEDTCGNLIQLLQQ